MKNKLIWMVLVFGVIAFLNDIALSGEKLPVQVPNLPTKKAEENFFLRHNQVWNVLPKGNQNGLFLDLRDTTLTGRLSFGVYQKDAILTFPRYRRASRIEKGKGFLDIRAYFRPTYDDNGWAKTKEGCMPYRIEVWDPSIRAMRTYDARVHFVKKNGIFYRALTLTEGPFVNLIRSDAPDRVVISWATDEPSQGTVWINGKKVVDSKRARRHEVLVTGLSPCVDYSYRVTSTGKSGSVTSREFSFQTAPPKGASHFKFAFMSDSRSGFGGGELNINTVNYKTVTHFATAAYRKGARFILMVGDLIDGYTTSAEDYRMELQSWKNAIEPFGHYRPVYVVKGNHETLLNGFDDGSHYGAGFDKWPYATLSAEALFAQEFINPLNGPASEDGASYDPNPKKTDFPTYKENVYAFQYGNILLISFDTNYWFSNHFMKYGGNFDGYILDVQFNWLKKELDRAEKDPTVDWVILAAHTPAFPNGGHLNSGMWYHGNNTLRPGVYDYKHKKLNHLKEGIIERRNTLWTLFSSHQKVLAVLDGDEHNYSRALITAQTPVGIPAVDDTDGDGTLDRFSPNPNFKYPVWQIISGGMGAPYYEKEHPPWEKWVKKFTSLQNFVLFSVEGKRVFAEVYSNTDALIERVDLTEIRTK
ncbi:MAG: metallophosphoesterase family protein [Calditrichaeota bacterium]|nr:metallophosphoesterase family protein [Calditrichota bacterium]